MAPQPQCSLFFFFFLLCWWKGFSGAPYEWIMHCDWNQFWENRQRRHCCSPFKINTEKFSDPSSRSQSTFCFKLIGAAGWLWKLIFLRVPTDYDVAWLWNWTSLKFSSSTAPCFGQDVAAHSSNMVRAHHWLKHFFHCQSRKFRTVCHRCCFASSADPPDSISHIANPSAAFSDAARDKRKLSYGGCGWESQRTAHPSRRLFRKKMKKKCNWHCGVTNSKNMRPSIFQLNPDSIPEKSNTDFIKNRTNH